MFFAATRLLYNILVKTLDRTILTFVEAAAAGRREEKEAARTGATMERERKTDDQRWQKPILPQKRSIFLFLDKC